MINLYKTTLTEQMHHLINDYVDFFESVPGVIILHDVRDWSVAYMNTKGLKELGLSLEELCALSSTEYFTRYFNADDAMDYVPKIAALMQNNNDDESISFYQQVKFANNDNWRWHLSSVRIFARNDVGNPMLTITISIPIDAMHHMAAKADRLLEENNFLRNNFSSFSKLSKREKTILKEMALGKSSVEIAEELCISSTTVDTHRRNIREKLETKSFFELSKYARAFDLI